MSNRLLDYSLKEDLKAKCAVVCSPFEETMRLDFVKIEEQLPIFQPNGKKERDQLREQNLHMNCGLLTGVAILMIGFAFAVA